MTASAVKSAARTLDILEFVARSAEPPTSQDISRVLNVPRSSLFHLISTLIGRGYLVQVGKRGGYALGGSVRSLTYAGGAADTAAIAGPLLKEISRPLNETAGYYELRGVEAEVVATESGRHALLYSLSIGERAPLYAVSPGKVMLAASPPEFIEQYMASTQFTKVTPYTITEEAMLRREIIQAQKTGFSYSMEEYTLGIVGVARAIKARNGSLGAINVALPAARFTPEMKIAIEKQLVEVCNRVQAAIAN